MSQETSTERTALVIGRQVHLAIGKTAICGASGTVKVWNMVGALETCPDCSRIATQEA